VESAGDVTTPTSPPAAAAAVEEAFSAFVAARGDALWRIAWLLTGDRQRAEDLVQTALAKTWPHWAKLSLGGSAEAYVRRVIYTTYLAWWRRRWNAEIPSEQIPEQFASTEPADAIALQRDLATALASLPRGQRAVVVLRYFEDRSESETAATLGISVGTVKSQTARAMATLRTSPLLRGLEEDR
jgi:RNA polymerase sigma-70 factor (sigma-E family)